MNREIAYRGKQTFPGRGEKEGDWVYGFFTYNLCDHLYLARIERSTGSEYGEPVDYIDVDLETVGQYTGKVDKNDKRIYEDDVLKYEAYENGKLISTVYLLVYWDEKLAAFMIKCSDSKFPDDMANIGEYEIIGNIHDNPELLEHFNKV